MKKLLTVLFALLLVCSLAACTSNDGGDVEPEPEPTPEVNYSEKREGSMTYAEYAEAAADGTVEVVVEAYVQAVQSYWDGATLYLADPDGAYLAYSAAISEEDYAKLGVATEYGAGWVGLANGTKVVVTGYKTAWAGEVEIDKGATVEVLADAPTWKAEAVDLTALLGDETLVDYQNKFFTAKDLTVDSAAIYNWDGSGAEGSNSDLYFNVSDGTNVYTFVVESYLCYEGSDVYNAVLALQPGDVIDVEGFLYWYEGANPHITSVTVK